MSQPPGPAPHGWSPQQGSPQQGPAVPARPPQVLAVVVLDLLMALGTVGLACSIVVSGVQQGSTMVVVLLLAFVVAGFGVLNALGAAALLHPRFPNAAPSLMGAGWIFALCLITLILMIARGSGGAASMLGAGLMIAFGIAVMVLLGRPSVGGWITARHQESIRQGHRPRQSRRASRVR